MALQLMSALLLVTASATRVSQVNFRANITGRPTWSHPEWERECDATPAGNSCLYSKLWGDWGPSCNQPGCFAKMFYDKCGKQLAGGVCCRCRFGHTYQEIEELWDGQDTADAPIHGPAFTMKIGPTVNQWTSYCMEALQQGGCPSSKFSPLLQA